MQEEMEPLFFPGNGVLELLDTSLDQGEVERQCQLLPSSPTSTQDFLPPSASATLEKHQWEGEEDVAPGAGSSCLTLSRACYTAP